MRNPERQAGTERASRNACALTLGCAALIVLSAHLAWTSVGSDGTGVAYTLTDLPIAVVALGSALAAIVGNSLAALIRDSFSLELAGVVAIALALTLTAFVVGMQAVATFVPDDLLPATARRTLFAGGAGAGAWTALAGSLGIVLATHEAIRIRSVAAWAMLRARGVAAVAAVMTLALALAAFVQLRQEPWLEVRAVGQTLRIDGLVVPWIAPATVVAGWLLAGGLALSMLGLWELGALVAATAAWMENAAAATTIAAADALARAPLGHAQATSAAWVAFATGLGSAGMAALLLHHGASRT